MLRRMADTFHHLLWRAGFVVKLDDARIATTSDDTMSVTISDIWKSSLSPEQSRGKVKAEVVRYEAGVPEVPIENVGSAGEIKVLGTQMTLNNDCTAEVKWRISRGWAAWGRHRRWLTSRAGSMRNRLELLAKVVWPSMFFNIGACNLTQRHLQMFRAAENEMQRRVIRFRVLPGHDGGSYLADAADGLSRLRKKYGLPRWDRVACQRVHDWAGHVGRFSKWAPQRYAVRSLAYRDRRYLVHLV